MWGFSFSFCFSVFSKLSTMSMDCFCLPTFVICISWAHKDFACGHFISQGQMIIYLLFLGIPELSLVFAMFYGNISVRAFLSRQEVQVQTPNHCEDKAIIWRDFLFQPRAQAKRDTLLCTFPVLGADSSSINFLLRESPSRGSRCPVWIRGFISHATWASNPKPYNYRDGITWSILESLHLVSTLLLIPNKFLMNPIMHVKRYKLYFG